MKFPFIISIIISLLIFLTAFSCSDEDDKPVSCSDRQTYLTERSNQIRAFAETSVCSGDFECRYIGFGSKACGGPSGYLIYTTSIDTLELTDMVNDFNNLQAKYNQECGGVSDCSILQPPTGFDCVDNTCIPIY